MDRIIEYFGLEHLPHCDSSTDDVPDECVYHHYTGAIEINFKGIEIIIDEGEYLVDYIDLFPLNWDKCYIISSDVDSVIKGIEQMLNCPTYHRYLSSKRVEYKL